MEEIIAKVEKLINLYKEGALGGERMPEDSNPNLEIDSKENYLYFTLPMALNYQRNSYVLWECAKKTYLDETTRFVFDPDEVLKRDFKDVQAALIKYKVALQKDKQTQIWIDLCLTFSQLFSSDIRNLFTLLDNDIEKIKTYIQKENKGKFPYLSGVKICNYWLYVISQYTRRKFKNIDKLTIAPDTHVCKASYKLGIINEEELNSSNVQLIVVNKWEEILKGSKYNQIDVHTPLWLWSKSGFKIEI